jgi:hypothetical protein
VRDRGATSDDGDDGGTPGEDSASQDAAAAGGRFGRSVATVGAVLALAATGIGVLFKVDPRIAPCLGGRNASFTGAPVFPHYGYQQFLQDRGRTDTRGYPNIQGAEVRYSYRVDDLRGQRLVLRVTLVSVNRDGSIRGVDTNAIDKNDLFVEDSFVPDQCSQAGGGTFFAHMPIDARGRYEIVLELFIGMSLDQRVALGQTPQFTA